MSNKTFGHLYNIGQEIYHKAPESPKGIILDIVYYYRHNECRYLVALGFDNEVLCIEDELSETINFK
jgi:hypothetical protein